MQSHQCKEYEFGYSDMETFLNRSFQQSYSNNYNYNHGQYYGSYTEYLRYNQNCKNIQDISDTNDSGVNSDDNDMDDELKDNKPVTLSAWKMKQMKLSPAGVLKRRKDANKRERKRMNGLNEAFERLRKHIPGTSKDPNKKLSKMDTLQMANFYIRQLIDLLEKTS